jgi:hypothetical protein
MINWFSRRKTNEQLHQLFSKYISPKAIDTVNTSKTSKLNVLSEGPIEFVFVVVQGSTSNATGQQLGAVATIAQRNGWMVQGFLCNLVVLVRGTLPIEEPLAQDRSAIVDKLLQSMQQDIKIVHGVETGSFGMMGSADRLTYGVLLPSFPDVMSALYSLPYGQAHEYRG